MKKKKIIPLLAACWVLAAAPAWSGNVDVGINVNIGAPFRIPVIVQEPPLFLAPAPLGFQIAVGVPYDLCIVDGWYYLLQGNVWHVGLGYNGPWQVVHHDHLPPGLRKHKLREIRSYRDREYVIYKKDKDHYRGRSYRPNRHEYDHKGDWIRDWDRYRRHRADHDRERDRDHDRDWYRQRRTDQDRDHNRDRYHRGGDDQGRDHAQKRYRDSDERADRDQRHDRGQGKGHGNGKGKWL